MIVRYGAMRAWNRLNFFISISRDACFEYEKLLRKLFYMGELIQKELKYTLWQRRAFFGKKLANGENSVAG